MRTGFTLLEVVVAILIGGMAVTAGATLFAGLDDRVDGIIRAGRAADRAANAEGLMRTLMANLDIDGASTAPLAGSAQSVRFRTWCQDPRGWLDRCAARLELRGNSEGLGLWLTLIARQTSAIDLRDGIAHGAIEYLKDVRGKGTWLRGWSTLVPPHAVLVVMDGDSLFLPVASGG